MKIFSEKLKHYRKAAGLSQAKLAGFLGVMPNTISNYEKNISTPELDKFVKIVKILDVNAADLLDLVHKSTVNKSVVSEPSVFYTNVCRNCELREKVIKSQEITIRVLEQRCNDIESKSSGNIYHMKATEST